jgi:coenzyme F420-reducing hydrogenase beta subunit
MRSDVAHGSSALLSPADVVRSGLCIGCGSCVAGAPAAADARMVFDRFGHLKPTGSRAWMTSGSEGFTETCPFSPSARDEDRLAANLFSAAAAQGEAGRFLAAYVGYVAQEDYRLQGSSGGMVTWMLTELLRAGLVDAAVHVTPGADAGAPDRFFGYRVSRSVAEVRLGAKSRYYPIELSEMLREIRTTPGRYAVVGVPCFIKAVQLLREHDPVLRERIAFTLGLFCGHMKSARFVESLAWQLDVDLEDVQQVDFRRKDPTRAANVYTATLTRRDGSLAVRDWWNLADGDWGAGFFQNGACNFCDDVIAETADVSFGDAWVEPYQSDGRGTNVVVVRSPVVSDLVARAIDEGRLALDAVDAEFVQRTQAAGFRQRREGLAYRLTWRRRGLRPRKRVKPDRHLRPRRKLIYRMRALITTTSSPVSWAAHRTRRPVLYLGWARRALAVYHGLAYSRGRVGRLLGRLPLGHD